MLIVICSFLLFPVSLISLFPFIYPLSACAAQRLGSPALGVGAMVVLACSLQSLRHLRDYSQSASPRDADCISSSESAFKDSCGEIIWASWIKNIYRWSVLRAEVCRLHPARLADTLSLPCGIPARLEEPSTDPVPSCPGPGDPEKYGESLV